MDKDWNDFFEEKRNAPPREYLVDAMQFVVNKGVALDIGAGTLRDSKFLTEQEFEKVVAFDPSMRMFEFFEDIAQEKLELQVSSFEIFDFKKDTYDLINAQYVFPYVSSYGFEIRFQLMLDSLKEDGLLVATFFGDRDSWHVSGEQANIFQTKEEIQVLLKDLKILQDIEIEKDDTVNGKEKHWHRFHITARKV